MTNKDHQTVEGEEYTLDPLGRNSSGREVESKSEDELIEELLWVYIGHNSLKYSDFIEKVSAKEQLYRFNAPAFFFPMAWFLYRKLYLEGILITFLIPMVINLVFPNLPTAVYMGLSASVAVFASQYYVNSAAKKIKKLIASGLSESELRARLERLGGVSNVGATVGGLVSAWGIAVGMMGVGQGSVELPNCQHPLTHQLAKQVIVENSVMELTKADIRVTISETLQKSPNKEYICRFKLVIGSQSKFFVGRVYWQNPVKGQVGLALAPETNEN